MTNFAVIGSITVTLLGAIFGLYQARKADRSATTTKTIELGVKDLVDQYRETNEELRKEVAELREKCEELETSLKNQTKKFDVLAMTLDEREAELLRLKHKHGEPLV